MANKKQKKKNEKAKEVLKQKEQKQEEQETLSIKDLLIPKGYEAKYIVGAYVILGLSVVGAIRILTVGIELLAGL